MPSAYAVTSVEIDTGHISSLPEVGPDEHFGVWSHRSDLTSAASSSLSLRGTITRRVTTGAPSSFLVTGGSVGGVVSRP